MMLTEGIQKRILIEHKGERNKQKKRKAGGVKGKRQKDVGVTVKREKNTRDIAVPQIKRRWGNLLLLEVSNLFSLSFIKLLQNSSF